MSDNTVRVEVVRAQFRYDREQYTQGDELEVPKRVVERHPQSLAIIEADADGEDEDDETDDDASDYEISIDDVDPKPRDLTVKELRDRIQDVQDIAMVKAIRRLEAENESRDTALSAIDARIEELEE